MYKYGKSSTIEKRVIKHLTETNTYLVEILNKLGSLPPKKTINAYKYLNNKTFLTSVSYSGYLSDLKLKEPPDLILNNDLHVNSEWTEYKSPDEKKINQVVAFVNCEVPAGKFNNFCKIKSTVYYSDGPKFYSLKTFEYYAPEIGLIKTESISDNGDINTFSELLNYYIEK